MRLRPYALSLLFAVPAASVAQVAPRAGEPRGPAAQADSLAPLATARQLAAKGDTAGAVRVLQSATASAPKNAVLWHAYGSLLYEWTRPHWRKSFMPAGIPNRIIAAETSLARAMILAPDSAQYAIDYARNLFATNSTSLSTSQRTQYKAIATAERLGDTALMVESATHLGLLLWRKFEMDADRYLVNPGVIIGTKPPGVLERTVSRAYVDKRPPFGIGLYNESIEFFRFARMAAPDNEEAFRREAMALSHRRRWQELRQSAQEQVARRPAQPWPWLTLGLAEHRAGRIVQAAAAFDSGMARLDATERDRLFFLPRVLRPRLERWYDTLPADLRDRVERVYWMNNDPSMLLPGNPIRSEFLARVVEAEIRFTDNEKPIRGTQTDKGEALVRLGPPDFVARKRDTVQDRPSTWYWYYFTPLDTFIQFGQKWGFGTAYGRSEFLDSIRDYHGAVFHNVPLVRRGVENVRSQVARFRAAGDSMDLFVVAEYPVGALRRQLATSHSEMRQGVFVIDDDARVIADQRSTFTVRGHDTLRTVIQTQQVRVSNAAMMGRVEVLEPDAQRVARGSFDLSGFAGFGFGMSDVLIANRVTPPATQDRARWADFTVEPSLGETVTRGAPISLLWETYDLRAVNGETVHRVSVGVSRIEGTGVVAVAGRVLGGIRGAITRARPDSGYFISYERRAVARPVIAEYLQVGLTDLRAGRYRVTVEIADLQADRRVMQSREFNVVDRRR